MRQAPRSHPLGLSLCDQLIPRRLTLRIAATAVLLLSLLLLLLMLLMLVLWILLSLSIRGSSNCTSAGCPLGARLPHHAPPRPPAALIRPMRAEPLREVHAATLLLHPLLTLCGMGLRSHAPSRVAPLWRALSSVRHVALR